MTAHETHKKAMNIAADARIKKTLLRITPDGFKAEMAKAYALEREAAMMLVNSNDDSLEPTRSILLRSAGWLAYNAGLLPEAQEMATIGLKLVKHSDIKEELEELNAAIAAEQTK